ncbi:protein POLLEN DEFECTIVE IN GUIDANCE 1 [Arachis duranensis]|uniref:Protein POLLEN DEFECTIVE IN GUIDANCE 1 n=1 Tax=Arachis duranensis TaxID=130453 RepID=A0A6P5NDY0_ARADU|nr:protein POLLEN DEFECTIVE IN GUIDANCE 1 [Arachis duranensis]XP_025680356.1 protein POLLEN DEFECTIVE IN GUIDANCE 1 [Arachis hypogaea]
MRYRGGGVIGGLPPQSQPQRRKKRKHKSAHPESVTFDSVNGSNHDFEVNTSQLLAEVTTDEMPTTSATEQSTATAASGHGFSYGELRYRILNGGATCAVSALDDGNAKELSSVTSAEVENSQKELVLSGGGNVARSDTVELNRVLLVHGSDSDKSPVTYFLEELYNGNSLRGTTTLGDEKGRERVYDTIFRLPWRCELLIDVGFFVCFNSFLSLLTVMPTRIAITIWRLLRARKFKRPSTVELSDFGCFLMMVCGVILLQQIDISLIYHMIRGQSTIKLYVIYNVLEIFDKLCQHFNGDVMRMLFHSAEGLAKFHPEMESTRFWIWRFISDQVVAIVASIVHSCILLVQAITLSACMVAHNNALPAMLVSNNFAEIKSYVFKGYNKDNVRSLVYFDSIERFHISALILFVLAQNILEAEGSWLGSFLINILLVFLCEMAIDIIKHSFIAKFNNIKPIAFSEFLEALCKQTLNIETEDAKKNLTFVPIAPACVVIRVLTPVYAANLPYNPFPWRLFWIMLFSAMTYIMLTSLKVLIGMILQKHATWYINRCERRKLHAD